MREALVVGMIVSSVVMPVDLLACAVQTEADGRLGDSQREAGEWVAHVALNRAQTGWWGTLEETLLRDFHGIGLCGMPQPWSLDIAREALRRQTDITGGSLFVLSYDDLARLGPGEPVCCIGTEDAGLCFFRDWVWE